MNLVKFWFNNARPIALPQSLLPTLTALALSYGAAQYSFVAALASCIGVIFAHLGMNLLDDWFDYQKGSGEARKKVANEGFRGRMVKYPYLESGQATPKQLLIACCIFLAIAALMGACVVWVRGWKVAYWAIAALIIGISYSGGPLKLAYRGLGESVIFVMFGPLLMTGINYAVTGQVTPLVVWLSLAVGLLVTNIVYSHSVLDAAPDAKMNKKTMAHLMKTPGAQIALSGFFAFMPYLLVAVAVTAGDLHPAFLAVFGVLPVSIYLLRSMSDFVYHRAQDLNPRWWMGPMGDFNKYRAAGLDWFLLRWLLARNIVQFFCLIISMVNFIVS